MLANSAIQKLERYGQLGLKRSDVLKYVQSSLKDEKGSNAYALTRIQSWSEGLQGLSRVNSFDLSSLVANEMLVYAAGFAVSLIQVLYNEEYRSSQPIPACISDLSTSDVVALLDTISGVVTVLDATTIAASVSVTEAYGMLLNVVIDFALALDEAALAAHASVLKSVKELLFVSCNKFRGSYTSFPVPSLLSVRTASAMMKATTHVQAGSFSLPLLVKASVLENRCSESGKALDRALADNLCHVCAFAVTNRATRMVVYFRGDDYRLNQSEVTNTAEYAAHTFATSAPIDASFTKHGAVSTAIARRWLESLPCLFKAFVSDAGWTAMAREQRRLKIQRDAQRKQEKVKKSAPKGASKILEDNRSAGGDQMSSRASNLSMGSTIVSLLKAQGQGGTNEELLSVLDTVDAETRSVLSNMSHASATSYLSFLSVIDAAAIEREELQRHESADHNTNLALIFFEQLVLSISQFIESLSEVTLTASGLVDTAWKQLERLFLVVQESLTPLDASIISSMSVEHRRVLIALDANPLFQFSHDMRYNGGLGYQILGVLFARIMSPLLDMENEATTFLIPQELQDASRQRGGARWSQLRSAQQESALAACLGVYESIAPQVINMHLNQIIRVVAAATSKTSDDSAPHEIAHSKMLELFLARIIVRLGKSNSALSVMNNFLKLVSDTDVTDTEVQRALQLMLRPSISASIKQSMEDCMDIESVLAYLGRVVEFLTGNEDEESHASAPSTTKAHLALGILEVVTLGVVPSTLTSSMIVERIAEVDLLLSTFIAASTKQGETVVRGLRALYSVRLVLDRCMVDLGVANMEQYVKVLEESLWQFETNATSIVTMGPRDLLDIVEAFSGDSVHLVCALTLQRLTLAHSVSTILGFSSAIRRHLKTLATFVLDQYARSSTARSAMMRLTLAQWKALSFYAKKSLIAAFVPVIREQCALGVSVETFLGDWSTAAGDVLDALTVLLLEATSDAKELPVLLAALALLVKGRATVPRLPQVLQCLVRLLPNAPQPTTACRLADLILLLLQCNARAAKHITSGRKPLDESHVRAAFTEYVAEPDELVTEELEAAAELPALYFASSLATFLVSSSSTLESHGRLLCTLFGLAAQRSNSEFVQAVVSALQCSVTSKAYNVLETFLSLVHTSHMDFAPKKRTRDDKPTSSSSSVFGAIATSLLQTLVKNSTNVDAHVLRVLRILVLLPGHASTLRDSHVDINGASLASHSADGIVVAIGLAFGDDSATKMLLAALQDADADTHHWDHMVQLLPLVVRSFSSDNSVVGWVLQKTLQSAVKAAATTSSTIHNTLSCLLELSRVSTFRFSLVKGHVKRFLDTAIMARVAACKTRDVSLDDIQIVLRLLRLPLSQYHGDESFVDVELMLMQLLPDFISAFAQGATGSVLAQCSSLVRDVFHILSSTFLDFNVFRHRAHLLAPLIGAWFTHILRGLDSGYNGSVTNALASFFFRLGRSLQRSLDLSDKGHESSAALQLGLSTDAFLLQQASIAGTMFTLSSSYLGNFARYAPELDFVASDILKLLHREKLPDVFARLSKKGESNKKNLSKSSYADLAFACVGGEEGKNLLRQALMNAVDGDTAGDSSIIFSARERYLQ